MALTTALPPGRDPGLPLWPRSPLHLGGGSAGRRAELHHDRHLRGTVCDGGGAGAGRGGQGTEGKAHYSGLGHPPP